MKGLKRFVLFFIFIIILTPVAIGGAALIKDDAMPSYLVDFDYQNYDMEQVLNDKLQSLAFSNLLGTSDLYLDEETVNKIIYKSIAENVVGGWSGLSYDVQGEPISVKGIWLHFDNNILSAYALLNYQDVETTATLKISITKIDEGYKISFDTTKIGSLPLPKAIFSYGFNTLQDYMNEDFASEYTYGELNINDLYVTITDANIQQMINENLGTDLVNVNDITLVDGKFIVSYGFNQENSEGYVLNETINEVKNLIQNDATKNAVEQALVLTDPVQNQFNDDFNSVIDNVILPILNNSNSTLADISSEDMDQINTLATDFQTLDETTQNAVVDAIVAQMDPQVIQDFENQFIVNNDPNATFADLIQQALTNGITIE